MRVYCRECENLIDSLEFDYSANMCHDCVRLDHDEWCREQDLDWAHDDKLANLNMSLEGDD